MKHLFTGITRLSLRFVTVSLLLALVLGVFGLFAVTKLKLELIPPIEFPQTVVLSQVEGMDSDEVLVVLTERLEDSFADIADIVNIESTTTGAFGSVLILYNEFGLDQEKLREEIQAAVDETWLPLRRIQPESGQDAEVFTTRLLGDLSPDVLVYLAEDDPNFLFQLAPDVWELLPADAVEVALAYLAPRTMQVEADQSVLERLFDQELVPQLESMEMVASVTVSGGQRLPDEEGVPVAATIETDAATTEKSLLLNLSPEVWAIVSAKVAGLDELDDSAVSLLMETVVDVPTAPPALPESWRMDRFTDASDLLEMPGNVAGVFNDFWETGKIEGPLGQTNDLTPETVGNMLAIAPSMADYFEAEHLVAMPADVFAALPADFISGLDGFTRDDLAAASLATEITGLAHETDPIDLPDAWMITPPQLITFSFDDLPLATFSVFIAEDALAGEETVEVTGSESTTETVDTMDATHEAEAQDEAIIEALPEGPALPALFGMIGEIFGFELDTADDMVVMQLSDEFAATIGVDALRAADFFNFLPMMSDPSMMAGDGDSDAPGGFDIASMDLAEVMPALIECNVNILALTSGDVDFAGMLIGCVSPEAITFVIENDPTFLSSLQPGTYEYFSDEVLALPDVVPPLPDVWMAFMSQPQFDLPLNADGILLLNNGHPSAVLNAINASVPEQYGGYEIRLVDSLTPAVVRYFAINETGFFAHLDASVLQKLSPAVLALIPEDVLESLDDDLAVELAAIANGEQPSAAAAVASLYATDAVPADPNAPVINAEDWGRIASYYGIELDTADDFFRFSADFQFSDASGLMNSIFDSQQAVAMAPDLFGKLPIDAVEYMLVRDPNVFGGVRNEVLQELSDEVLGLLSTDLQARAVTNGDPFEPEDTITRTNGASSLQLTVFKTSDANTVEAYHDVEDLLEEISAENENIDITVVFEQASFIEESIDGVAREGGLGGVFAVIMILLFLSNGAWGKSARKKAGAVITILAIVLLALVVAPNLDGANGDIWQAFANVNLTLQVPLVILLFAGVLTLAWPGTLPYPAWRSTMVTAVSIPLSVLMALAFMYWVPPAVNKALTPYSDSSIITVILRLFPESMTLNIMTLSGLTVAIGRIVDDSIVVLENIFRQLHAGVDRREAVITGTRDVSVAIFAATIVTVVVFLPLGMTGGIIGEFFLPFGLAVTYSLLASFIVAITIVPVLAYLFVTADEVADDDEGTTTRIYLPILRWALANNRNRFIVLGLSFATMIFGFMLLGSRPSAFLPDFGEPQITVDISLPSGTKILETNALVQQFEEQVNAAFPAEDIKAVETVVGGGGANMEALMGGGNSITENAAAVTIGLETQDSLADYTQQIRTEAEEIFGEDNVTVSAASVSGGGMGGFALVLSGPQDELIALDADVIAVLNDIEGLTNVTSTISEMGIGNDGPATYLRVNQQSAVNYTGELETENTLGVTREAKDALNAMPNLPESVTVSEGFSTEMQTQGFAGLFVAMGIAMLIVIVVLIITFGSIVHWLDIMLSVMVAPVGAAIALTVTNRVLGISALIGMLMLIGIVVTNAVVLIDRVMANRRERKMSIHDSLIEAGGRRLRPILMTAFATIFALVPLAIGLSSGAIIASELGTVVIGGLFSSTLLTLIVVPVAFSLLHPVHEFIMRLFGRATTEEAVPLPEE